MIPFTSKHITPINYGSPLEQKEELTDKDKERKHQTHPTHVKGARKKGATLRDWFESENWINVATGEPCGK